jgi:hypothetical protein
VTFSYHFPRILKIVIIRIVLSNIMRLYTVLLGFKAVSAVCGLSPDAAIRMCSYKSQVTSCYSEMFVHLMVFMYHKYVTLCVYGCSHTDEGRPGSKFIRRLLCADSVHFQGEQCVVITHFVNYSPLSNAEV